MGHCSNSEEIGYAKTVLVPAPVNQSSNQQKETTVIECRVVADRDNGDGPYGNCTTST